MPPVNKSAINRLDVIMSFMDTSAAISKKTRGQQLVNAERIVLIGKLVDTLSEGYITTNALAKKLGVSRTTIDVYRPLADKLIAENKWDRNVIRNLQIKRTYKLIEALMEDLKTAVGAKDRSLYYNQIYKFSSHLALITGLNVETTVHIDPHKLVIIRANHQEKQDKVLISSSDGVKG